MADKRDLLLNALKKYQTSDEHEADMLAKLISFIESHEDCFDRSNQEGHITGSALVINPDGDKVLLTHHRKLDRWLQFGGHSDGDPDTWNVALREAQEESGIEDLEFVSRDIMDVDVHPIPDNLKKGEPKHFHYDVRFLLRAKSEEFEGNHESHKLKWFTWGELDEIGLMSVTSLKRMFDKWHAIVNT